MLNSVLLVTDLVARGGVKWVNRPLVALSVAITVRMSYDRPRLIIITCYCVVGRELLRPL